MANDEVSQPVTLKDVAGLVGITPAAASMALSGNERISAKTRERVREAAAELGYVPSSAGRALRKQKAGAIALIVPNTSRHVFGHSYFMHVLTGVSAAANARDTQVLVSTSADEAIFSPGPKERPSPKPTVLTVITVWNTASRTPNPNAM